MKLNENRHRIRGYLLQEVIVGLVIFAIAMLPILRALVLVPRIAAAMSAQARAESWRSAGDRAVSLGIDATVTPFLGPAYATTGRTDGSGRIVRANLPARMGAPQINLISEIFDSTAEERGIAAGVEIAGNALPIPPRADPLPPRPPIKLTAPSLTPANGTFLNVLALSPGPGLNGAFVATLEAAGATSADFVHLLQRVPQSRTSFAIGTTRLQVDAVELSQAVQGRAWSEYAGNQEADTPVVLEDGRTRWLVRSGSQIQVYEPSDLVEFIYGVDLGRPIYRLNGADHLSGETVGVDYALARKVESGVTDAIIAYSQDVQSRFGKAWSEVEPRFSWSFGSYPGDSSAGITSSFYTAWGRPFWQATQTLSAVPQSSLLGVRAFGGTWNLQRLAQELQPPERTSSFYDASIDQPGSVDFSAPVFADTGTRVGRPEVDGVESVGSVLTITLLP